MKRKTREKIENERGITLVALVVTIVVLLILAGISLNLVLGQNGIVSKSKEAKEKGTKDQENTETALNTLYDEMMGAINDDENPGGSTGGSQFPDAVKHPEQSSTNNDIGIGTDGQPVNLDLWNYTVISNNCIELCKSRGGCFISPGYENANIVEGKIQGKVPQYIKISGQNEFYTVTSMSRTFSDCSSLTTAPEIPSSITNMQSTFSGCSSLTTALEIPSSITNMQSTFSGCSSLTTVPEIPSSITNMSNTFADCSSLTTAPEIPSSVTNMQSTFSGCSSLTTAPEIPSSVTDMAGTFSKCSSLTVAPTIPSSVTVMSHTFWRCSSLTIAPEIPSAVTSMYVTFGDCTSLTTAPTIPSSVANMAYTFQNCSALTGNIIINASPSNYNNCFNGAATNEGTNLIVSGTSTKLDEIIATKSENSNITKAEGL